jgi:hypothetical protein
MRPHATAPSLRAKVADQMGRECIAGLAIRRRKDDNGHAIGERLADRPGRAGSLNAATVRPGPGGWPVTHRQPPTFQARHSHDERRSCPSLLAAPIAHPGGRTALGGPARRWCQFDRRSRSWLLTCPGSSLHPTMDHTCHDPSAVAHSFLCMRALELARGMAAACGPGSLGVAQRPRWGRGHRSGER